MNVLTRLFHASGSETARRRSRMFGWALTGHLVIAANLALSIAAHRFGWVTPAFAYTVLWGVLPYWLAFVLLDNTLHLPPIEGNSIVVTVTLVPVIFLLVLFAMFHLEYSRGAVLLSYVTTLLWVRKGYRSFVEQYVPVYGYTNAADYMQLQELLNVAGARATRSACTFRKLASLDEAVGCDGLLVDRFSTSDPERTRMLARLKLSHVRIYSIEKLAELLTGRVGLSHIDDNFFDDYADHYFYSLLKRLIDITAVLVLIPVALPLSVLVAVAIRLESRGPALFRQLRSGLDDVPFTMYKFRSMAVTDTAPAQFASHADPRITRVGKWIRKYRFDELPQLWNVLRGDMSMIGPRPEQVPMVKQFSDTIPFYPYRHLVRPGLSGWAQVQQGYVSNEKETVTKLSYDLYYVKHCSLALDLLIGAKTIQTILTGFGAR
ncbi:exopolysaccharide biosynthesis polyprenyl glycosylphosphotransferase [Ralstonia sp. ASV6]|uniref:exopolysaccharide biosynthesis polyprenyl glycosylphosphotransferase n=1 Tax=Ralstonia sp. ASV6 TaxID=2795124 RepID=UPI001E3CB968|nr:exopolysaccharide biosynthesis polyprenyl glycosylphosphotransferase [Ralstonia sp. ASV6]